MASNSILMERVRAVNGSYVGTTGKTTVLFPANDRAGFLLMAGSKIYYCYFTSNTATSLQVLDLATGSAVSDVTQVSGWKYEIGGMPWYSSPRLLVAI